MASGSGKKTTRSSLSPIKPFETPAFRMLWTAWLMANVCMWMSDVAAVWVMSSLTITPIWIALVQAAATLPVVLFGIVSGALADIFDRRRYLLLTQAWVVVVAGALALFVWQDWLSPVTLLALVFANGIGLAMRLPVFAALIPELVPREQLPAAVALNGLSVNASRIIGPLVAGIIIAYAGSVWVFCFNAIASLIIVGFIARWKREPRKLGHEREPLLSALRTGVLYAAHSYQLKSVLLRTFIYFFHSSGLMALLAVLGRAIANDSAHGFTLLIAAMGAGALTTVPLLLSLRGRRSEDAFLMYCALAQGVAFLGLAFADSLWTAMPLMFLSGGAWLSAANTLAVAAQDSLVDWVRARGMSIYQIAIMGSVASGSAVWGFVATVGDVQLSFIIAGVSSVLLLAMARRLMPTREEKVDHGLVTISEKARTRTTLIERNVIEDVEYLVASTDLATMHSLMDQSRRSWLSKGAIDWTLIQDVDQPGRIIERIVDSNWQAHLRRIGRMSQSDLSLHERKCSIHIGERLPVASRYTRIDL